VLLAAEGLALLAAAVILAGPVPLALARAAWPVRSPRAGLVLWQAVGLSGGLAILGAGLTLTVSGLHRSWLGGLDALPARLGHGLHAGLGPLGWAGLALTVVAAGWLGCVLAWSTARLLLARREHRQRLDLLADELSVAELAGAGRPGADHAEPGARGADLGAPGMLGADREAPRAPGMPGADREAPGAPGRLGADLALAAVATTLAAAPCRGPAVEQVRVRLVDHPAAAAYCLPGVRPRIVLSQGVLDALSHCQLLAVVAHEEAHARGHHDLVIQPFRAWRQTFPFLPAARRALAAVELLVEMLADDTARRRQGAAPVAAALARLAAVTPADVQAGARAARLAAPPPPLPRLAALAAGAVAVVLVALPPVILLAS